MLEKENLFDILTNYCIKDLYDTDNEAQLRFQNIVTVSDFLDYLEWFGTKYVADITSRKVLLGDIFNDSMCSCLKDSKTDIIDETV